MRASDFVIEAAKKGTIDHEHDRAIPNARTLPSVDQGYGLYRFGLHMATSPEPPNIPTTGAIGNSPFFVPYSQGDLDIINQAGKAGGFGSVKHLTHGPSSESDDVYRTSPVKISTRARKRKLRK